MLVFLHAHHFESELISVICCVFVGEKPKMICGCDDPETMKLWLTAFKDVQQGGGTPRAASSMGRGF